MGSYEDVTGQNAKDAVIFVQGIEYGSPAQKMDLRIGDILIGNGVDNFSTVGDVQNYISNNKGKEITLIVKRKNDQIILKGIPREKVDLNQGALGITNFGEVIKVKYSFFRSLKEGAVAIKNSIIYFSYFIAQIFHGNKDVISQTGGPVFIVVLTGKAIALGFSYVINFVAMLSLNLAILNVLPFPFSNMVLYFMFFNSMHSSDFTGFSGFTVLQILFSSCI